MTLYRRELSPAGFNCCFPSIHDQTGLRQAHGIDLVTRPARPQGGRCRTLDRIRQQEANRCIDPLREYAQRRQWEKMLRYDNDTPLDIGNKFEHGQDLNNRARSAIADGSSYERRLLAARHPYQESLRLRSQHLSGWAHHLRAWIERGKQNCRRSGPGSMVG